MLPSSDRSLFVLARDNMPAFEGVSRENLAMRKITVAHRNQTYANKNPINRTFQSNFFDKNTCFVESASGYIERE
jgi:hypothetical protein